ncbi:MAG TPA: cysteine--tRNA ligase [Candidatus Pacearchaeota archaeon]|nr:cysteine--tRNA ligase [Candidatus Pacearchaeota archaeon]
MIKLYNTLTRKLEEFKPINEKEIGLYTCGPTVYWFAHIGNLRTYIFEDILKRVLEYNGYRVNHIMNITDVGHLTSDEDIGEDKLEKSAEKEKKTVLDIAEFYTNHFKKDIEKLNIEFPTQFVKATETIKEQIELIKLLEQKGFTYRISDGIYFDTQKLDDYGVLWGEKEKTDFKSRIEENEEKKHPADFALWKFSPKDKKRQMEWASPWGIGFPGWHTECVAIGIKYLGIPFDIHCGGIDHISVHHTNEIAQAKAAYGNILANYWLHGEFLILKNDDKMSKSKGNIVTLDNIENPLAYRYLCLGAHYRSKLNYSNESLEGAKISLNNLKDRINELDLSSKAKNLELKKDYDKKFLDYINDDLDMPKALALTWEVFKDNNISDSEKYELVQNFDKILGLNLKQEKIRIPEEIIELANEREIQRKNKNYQKSDDLRKIIEQKGYIIKDEENGFVIKKSDQGHL